MTCTNLGDAIVCQMWSGPFKIKWRGKTYRFEDSEMFGPAVLDRNDQPLDRQPGEGHPFWDAYDSWSQEGRKLAADGETCVTGDAP